MNLTIGTTVIEVGEYTIINDGKVERILLNEHPTPVEQIEW